MAERAIRVVLTVQILAPHNQIGYQLGVEGARGKIERYSKRVWTSRVMAERRRQLLEAYLNQRPATTLVVGLGEGVPG